MSTQSGGQGPRDPNSATLPVGFKLASGHYSIIKVLGQGGFGITYLAYDTHSGRKVAIKELFPAGSMNRNPQTGELHVSTGKEEYCRHICQRFREEAMTIATLRNHREIIQVYDIFDDLGTVYYVMEYLEGEDYGHFLKKYGPQSWDKIAKPIFDTITALGIIHEHGLIHRDISPDNIFMLYTGGAKLIDFGSVRRQSSDHFTTIFKDAFAPVEMFLSDGDQGPWTDTYSLAATIYYLLSGKLPAKSPDRISKIKLEGKDPLIPLRQYAPNVPEYIEKAIYKGIEPEAEKRFRSSEEMKAAFFPNPGGYRQTGEMQQPAIQQVQPQGGNWKLLCVKGRYCGQTFLIRSGHSLNLGRGAGNEITFPDDPHLSQGISRRQCAFYADPVNGVFVQDLNSRFGTFLGGMRIPAGQWCKIEFRQNVRVGSEEFMLIR